MKDGIFSDQITNSPATARNQAFNIDILFPNLIRNYMNEYRLYAHLFQRIPNKITQKDIEIKPAYKWFLDSYSHCIERKFYHKAVYGETKTPQIDDLMFILTDETIVYFDFQEGMVRYLFSADQESTIDKMAEEVQKFKTKLTNSANINLLIFSGSYFNIENFPLNTPKFELNDNYNDDLTGVHEIICKRLNKENDKGLVLLHGDPGTGKTSYLRHLTSEIKKRVIFFPPNLAENITHPNFISFLIEHPNSILVIEDAENILLDRHFNDKTSVSALLNLSDGLLSDCLNIQVICTFNTDITKIDSALLRKGRLIASYKFEALETPKAQALSNKLGFQSFITEPTKVTNIYNQAELHTQEKKQKTIGFNQCN